jgi:hypothetical protein
LTEFTFSIHMIGNIKFLNPNTMLFSCSGRIFECLFFPFKISSGIPCGKASQVQRTIKICLHKSHIIDSRSLCPLPILNLIMFAFIFNNLQIITLFLLTQSYTSVKPKSILLYNIILSWSLLGMA